MGLIDSIAKAAAKTMERGASAAKTGTPSGPPPAPTPESRPGQTPRPEGALSNASKGQKEVNSENRASGYKGDSKSLISRMQDNVDAEENEDHRADDQAKVDAIINNAELRAELSVQSALNDGDTSTDGDEDSDDGIDNDLVEDYRAIEGWENLADMDHTERVAVLEILHQKDLDMERIANDSLASAEGEAGTTEDKVAAMMALESREALLQQQREIMKNDDINTDEVDENFDSDEIDHYEGFNDDDIEAHRAYLDEQIANVQEQQAALAESFTPEELGELEAMEEVQLQDAESGETTSIAVSDGFKEHIIESSGQTPAAAPAEGTEGADGAPTDPTVTGETPINYTDGTHDELLLEAAGVPADAPVSFNENGELVYTTQPGQGHWNIAAHMQTGDPNGDPQDLAAWQTQWNNHDAKRAEQGLGGPPGMLAVGEEVVVPGYSREEIAANDIAALQAAGELPTTERTYSDGTSEYVGANGEVLGASGGGDGAGTGEGGTEGGGDGIVINARFTDAAEHTNNGNGLANVDTDRTSSTALESNAGVVIPAGGTVKAEGVRMVDGVAVDPSGNPIPENSSGFTSAGAAELPAGAPAGGEDPFMYVDNATGDVYFHNPTNQEVVFTDIGQDSSADWFTSSGGASTEEAEEADSAPEGSTTPSGTTTTTTTTTTPAS